MTTSPSKPRTVYVVGSSHNANWCQAQVVSKMEDADFVVLPGGSDWDPSLFGHPRHPTTHYSEPVDRYEMREAKRAIQLGLPWVGLCRGGQLANILAGAPLVQDQSHPYRHVIECHDGKTRVVNSLHHQSAYPWDLPKEDYRVLGFSRGLSPYHMDGNDQEMMGPDNKEVEISYYPRIKALNLQSHPEMMYGRPEFADTITYMQSLLTSLLDGSIASL